LSLDGALAIFVKTPGLSPVKTRLAKDIGETAATDFYKLSVQATAANAKRLQERNPNLQIYWAVAEAEAISANLWKEFPTVFQGTGGLGSRLSKVYQELLGRHHFACFIGADSPQIDFLVLEDGILKSARNLKKKFTMGNTEDGGFFFWGGSVPVSEMMWTSILYSSPQTSNDLMNAFKEILPFEFLSPEIDIDTIEDIPKLARRLEQIVRPTPEQARLLIWLKSKGALWDSGQCV